MQTTNRIKIGDNETITVGDNVTIDAGDDCKIECGNNCRIKIAFRGTTNAGNDCKIEAGWYSTVIAGDNSKVKGTALKVTAGINSKVSAYIGAELSGGEGSLLKWKDEHRTVYKMRVTKKKSGEKYVLTYDRPVEFIRDEASSRRMVRRSYVRTKTS